MSLSKQTQNLSDSNKLQETTVNYQVKANYRRLGKKAETTNRIEL